MSQRDIESTLEKALGQFVVAKMAVSDMTDRLSHAYEAFRTRDLSGFDRAHVCIDTVYAPLRRRGSMTGLVDVWGICVDGRKVLLTLSTAQSESDDRGLEVLRDLGKRELQTPVTVTTDGAPGLLTALEVMGPRSLRQRCWSYQRQTLHEKGPPQAWPAGKVWVADRREAPTFEEGQRHPQVRLAPYQTTLPEACRCLEDDVEASLNHLQGPARHH